MEKKDWILPRCSNLIGLIMMLVWLYGGCTNYNGKTQEFRLWNKSTIPTSWTQVVPSINFFFGLLLFLGLPQSVWVLNKEFVGRDRERGATIVFFITLFWVGFMVLVRTLFESQAQQLVLDAWKDGISEWKRWAGSVFGIDPSFLNDPSVSDQVLTILVESLQSHVLLFWPSSVWYVAVSCLFCNSVLAVYVLLHERVIASFYLVEEKTKEGFVKGKFLEGESVPLLDL